MIPGIEDLDKVLEDFTLEELLEMMDITPQEVLEILLNSGYAVLPEFLSTDGGDEKQGKDD